MRKVEVSIRIQRPVDDVYAYAMRARWGCRPARRTGLGVRAGQASVKDGAVRVFGKPYGSRARDTLGGERPHEGSQIEPVPSVSRKRASHPGGDDVAMFGGLRTAGVPRRGTPRLRQDQ